MIEIHEPRHGAILNRKHGREDATGLEVVITGCADPAQEVWVNGRPAERAGLQFSATVRLTQRENEIRAETRTVRGVQTQAIRVLWDRRSFKRYRFFIDDHVFFLEDIVRQQYRSLFDCFYLKRLREFHAAYGTKVVLNLFFRNDHGDSRFEITQMPDRYRGEWRDHADWLKLSFHAHSEFPDRPYAYCSAAKLAHDYDAVQEQVARFAGAESFCPPIVIHWAVVQPACFKVLTDRGVRTLSGQFRVGQQSVEAQSDAERFYATGDIGYFLDTERSLYLAERRVIHDFGHGITFMIGDVCCNRYTVEQAREFMAPRFADELNNELVGLASHEQYTFPFYRNYLPDHFDRMDDVLRAVTEHGYAPVWFHEGLLGNRAWEE